jgi:hypothetical protein
MKFQKGQTSAQPTLQSTPMPTTSNAKHFHDSSAYTLPALLYSFSFKENTPLLKSLCKDISTAFYS